MPIKHWSLVEVGTGRVVVERLELADRFWPRLRGWQFRRRPPAGFGLLLAPATSIHTCWLRFPLAVVALDARGTVLRSTPVVHTWRLHWGPRGTRFIVELPAGDGPVPDVGATLGLRGPVEKLPASLRELAAGCPT